MESLNSKCTQGKVLYYLMFISRMIFLEIRENEVS